MFYLAVVWTFSILIASVAGWAAYVGFRGARVYWISGEIGRAVLLGAFAVIAALTALGFVGGAFESRYLAV